MSVQTVFICGEIVVRDATQLIGNAIQAHCLISYLIEDYDRANADTKHWLEESYNES
jgi:hypothetical protein